MKSLEQIYQALALCVARTGPRGWERIHVEASVLDDWSKASFYADTSSSPTAARFLPPVEAELEISDALIEMRQLMSAEGKEQWNKIRFTLDRDGKFHVDYNYDPALEGL